MEFSKQIAKENNVSERGFLINEREMIFSSIVTERLIEDFEDSLFDVGFEVKEVDDIKDSMLLLSNGEILSVLSVPYDIRKDFLSKYKKLLDGGNIGVEGVVFDILNKTKNKGYTVGYHLSPANIKPTKTSRGSTWIVNGYEVDDRDDKPMAYYSTDYSHIYRKRRGSNKLYIVRAETGEGTSHKLDSSNNWGRAPSLSIITCLEMSDLDAEVEKVLLKKVSSAD